MYCILFSSFFLNIDLPSFIDSVSCIFCVMHFCVFSVFRGYIAQKRVRQKSKKNVLGARKYGTKMYKIYTMRVRQYVKMYKRVKQYAKCKSKKK